MLQLATITPILSYSNGLIFDYNSYVSYCELIFSVCIIFQKSNYFNTITPTLCMCVRGRERSHLPSTKIKEVALT